MPEYKTTHVPTPAMRTTHLRPAKSEAKVNDWDDSRTVLKRLTDADKDALLAFFAKH